MDTESAKWQSPRCQSQLGLNNLCWHFEQMQTHNGILTSGSSLGFLVEATPSSRSHSAAGAVGFLFPGQWWAGLKGETCLRGVFHVVRMGSTIAGWSTPVPHHTHVETWSRWQRWGSHPVGAVIWTLVHFQAIESQKILSWNGSTRILESNS